MKTYLKYWGPLFLILGLALWLRVYQLSANPPSLNWDEVSHGYNAYSIAKTGRDEWGKPWPMIFRAYGDYKLPLYIYLTVLPVKLFGLSPISVRLISVLAGLGLTYVAYLLGRFLWKKQGWALLAALLTAISPWSVFVSRIAVEANLAAFLFALGFWLYLKKHDLWAIFAMGLAMETYNAARIAVPLIFLYWLIGKLKKKAWKSLIPTILLMALVSLPVIWQFANSTGEARLFWTTPLDQGAINRIEEQRHKSPYSPLITRLLYNRPLYFMGYIGGHYFQHFGLNFLFVQGGNNYQFSLPDHGLLFLIIAPFFFYGIFLFITERRWQWLFWLFIAFLPSAMTKDSPHVLHSLLILPLPMLLTVAGLRKTRDYLGPRSQWGGNLIIFIVLFGLAAQVSFWWRDYWRIYRPAYSWAWQYGYRQAVGYAKVHYGEYNKIIFTKRYGEPHEFVLFYWPWEPDYYQHDSHKKWNYHAHWYWVDGFDKFEFWNNWEVKKNLQILKNSNRQGKTLLVTAPGNWIPGGKLLKTINFLDGGPAFDIVAY